MNSSRVDSPSHHHEKATGRAEISSRVQTPALRCHEMQPPNAETIARGQQVRKDGHSTRQHWNAYARTAHKAAHRPAARATEEIQACLDQGVVCDGARGPAATCIFDCDPQDGECVDACVNATDEEARGLLRGVIGCINESMCLTSGSRLSSGLP